MENKINIAEILKDCSCSSGMELDCTIYEDVYFDYVDELNIIHCYIQHETYKTSLTFNKYGIYNRSIKAKCVIFPKGKTTWEGFQRPFKDGDIINIITENKNEYITIFKDNTDNYIETYADFTIVTSKCSLDTLFYNDNIKYQRLATEEEKEKLFKAIKDNGYKWNEETKTLEKLSKFKVGDKIQHKNDGIHCTLGKYVEAFNGYRTNIGLVISYDDIDNWELVPNKFDINTLKPFDKVLVRNKSNEVWTANFYSHYDATSDKPFICVGWSEMNEYRYCIPYEVNNELLGTTNNTEEYGSR